MCKHEEKPCPRCQQSFECKPGDVVHCQCYGITLTTEERAFIEERYAGKGPRFIFITGGARSGKSRYAQQLALELSELPVYIATARAWDDNFRERIRRHQQGRDERWTSIEEEKYISRLSLQDKVVVIDCITLWLTNFFVDYKNNIEQCLAACKEEVDAWQKTDNSYIIVSNEIGMGVHAETEIGRRFTDLQGWINQYIAQKATTAVLMVSGLPVKIK